MKKPTVLTAPPLVAMAAHKDKLEALRAELYPKWCAAIEAAEGNVTQAAVAMFPERERATAKSYGMWLTKTFGLREFAAELRERAGNKKLGRQWHSSGKSK